MYNVAKSGNTPNESEILEPLHACLRELLEYQRQGKDGSIIYTDDDVIAITLLYSTILGSRLANILASEKVGITLAVEMSRHYAALVNETTQGMSRVNTSAYYKGR